MPLLAVIRFNNDLLMFFFLETMDVTEIILAKPIDFVHGQVTVEGFLLRYRFLNS